MDADQLAGGVQYVYHLLGVHVSLLQYATIIPVVMLISELTSLIWFSLLLHIPPKPLILISVVLNIFFLISACVIFIAQCFEHQADTRVFSDTWLYRKYVWIILCSIGGTFTVSFCLVFTYFIPYRKLAIEIVEEVGKAIFSFSLSSLLKIGFLESLIRFLLLSLAVFNSLCLATSESPSYRVINSCFSETCINTESSTMFSNDDQCDPTSFPECTGCPHAQCVYHDKEQSGITLALQFLNIVSVIWLMRLTGSFFSMVIAELFIKKYWRSTQPYAGVWEAVKKTFHLYPIPVMVGSCIPPVVSNFWGTYVMVAVHGHGFYKALVSKYSRNVQTLEKMSKFIILTQKLFVTGLVAVNNYIIYIWVYSPNHQIWIQTLSLNSCYIAALLLVSFNMFRVYDIGISTLFLWNKTNRRNFETEDSNQTEIFNSRFKNIFKDINQVELKSVLVPRKR